MPRSASEIASAPTNSAASARRIDVVEILDVTVSDDWTHVDLSVLTPDGQAVALRVPQATIAQGLGQVFGMAALAVETSIAASATKLNAAIGEWEVAGNFDAATRQSNAGRPTGVALPCPTRTIP